jgi:hypothetical protein
MRAAHLRKSRRRRSCAENIAQNARLGELKITPDGAAVLRILRNAQTTQTKSGEMSVTPLLLDLSCGFVAADGWGVPNGLPLSKQNCF